MRIKKISPTTPANGNIENQYGTSQTNAYSENYANTTFATKDVATTSANGLMSSSDKTKLDACVTTTATSTANGLMSSTAFNKLDNIIFGLSSISDIDTVHGNYMGIVAADASGTKPTGLGGNRFLVIGFASRGSNGMFYGTQIAISFGSRGIATRNCNYNSAGTGTWSAWGYISPT